ncbi:MAG: MoaD/ThiS family protein [Candidatus Hodarchaeales archaeon]|jgi:molybdopterin converting factor small subunit
MNIQLVFLGSFQYDFGVMEQDYKIKKGTNIQNLCRHLAGETQFRGLKTFFTENYESPRSVIIFINDQDISVLEGMASILKEKDKVTFIPVIHGGKNREYLMEK